MLIRDPLKWIVWRPHNGLSLFQRTFENDVYWQRKHKNTTIMM